MTKCVDVSEGKILFSCFRLKKINFIYISQIAILCVLNGWWCENNTFLISRNELHN